MDWSAVGAVGEILGAIAVFLTLLYLAAQIRQANKLAHFEATREIMAQFNACNLLIATDAKIRNVLLKEGELSVDEAEQLYSYVDMYCNAWGTTQMAFDQGLVEASIWAGVMKDVEVAMNRWPNMRQSVERWLNNYPDFKDLELFRAVRSR
jgi:hypothetical protein